jgi:hypothetical protein
MDMEDDNSPSRHQPEPTSSTSEKRENGSTSEQRENCSTSEKRENCSTSEKRENRFHDRFSSVAPKVKPEANFSITRSISASNPLLSQVKLRSLTFTAVFKWNDQMEVEQQGFIWEILQWGRYIDPPIGFQIQAINNHNEFSKQIFLDGEYIDMNNEDLYDLLVQIVGPKSLQEYVSYFKTLVRFPQLPSGYIFDITKFDFLYTAILQYLFSLRRVIKLLDWKAVEKHSPPIKTRDGKIGYIELVYSRIPDNIGRQYLFRSRAIFSFFRCRASGLRLVTRW